MSKNLIHLLVASTTILQVCSVQVTLSEVRSLGAQCPDNLDNCRIPSRSVYKKERTCECDEKCAFFDDCCVDSRYRPETAKPRPENVKCLTVGHFATVYAVDTCRRDFKNNRIKKLCEDNNFFDNRIDGVPVTDPNSEITYVNKYCAVCNGVDLSSTFFWQLGTTAGNIKYYYQNVTSQEIIDNIQYDGNYHNFVKYDPEKNETKEYYLSLTYFFPSYRSDKVRFCWKNLVSDCPQEWKDDDFREKCRSYFGALFFYKLLDSRMQYRNIHCAVCNNITFSPGDYRCEQEATHVKLTTSFLILMDFNFKDGERVSEKSTKCENGVYDVFAKKCRQLVCGLPGYVMVNGKCERV